MVVRRDFLTSGQIVEFDTALKKNDDNALKHTWAIVSALSLWINEVDQGPLMGMCSTLSSSHPHNANSMQVTKTARRHKL